MTMQRFYVIYDKTAERIVSTYTSSTCPALYPTYGMARGLLKKRKAANKRLWANHEVREVEVHIL